MNDLERHRLGLTWIERGGTFRSSHALGGADGVWLIDPFEDADALVVAAELGPPRGVIQLLDRHNRDCAALAQRLGVPLHRVPDGVPDSPFQVVPVIANRLWNEVALAWPQENALVVAEAVGTIPFFALGRRAGVHPALRLTPPRSAFAGQDPDMLLVGHGAPVDGGGGAALREALGHARSDLPRFVVEIPKLVLRR